MGESDYAFEDEYGIWQYVPPEKAFALSCEWLTQAIKSSAQPTPLQQEYISSGFDGTYLEWLEYQLRQSREDKCN